jgi:hypothetical protein
MTLFLVCCGTEVSTLETFQEQEVEHHCNNIKKRYCELLLECEDIEYNFCYSLANIDNRCEKSEFSIQQIKTCENELYDASCLYGMPPYCKKLIQQKE